MNTTSYLRKKNKTWKSRRGKVAASWRRGAEGGEHRGGELEEQRSFLEAWGGVVSMSSMNDLLLPQTAADIFALLCLCYLTSHFHCDFQKGQTFLALCFPF